MTNEELLKRLQQGVDIWNQWRKENFEVTPYLRRANLSGFNLIGVNLSGADLMGADLRKANLRGADLRRANLRRANLCEADLSEVDLSKANLRSASLRKTIFHGADLSKTDFRGADLQGVNLRGTKFIRTNLREADLRGVNLYGVDLCEVDLIRTQALRTNFENAIFTGACLEDWNINSTTNFKGAICEYVYLKTNKQERRPRNGIFKPNEFTALFQKAVDTIDLIFNDGIDWQAFFQSFQDLRGQYAGQDLSIQAIEKKRGGAFIVRVEVAEGADKLAIEGSAKELYETKLAHMEKRYRAELQAKSSEIVYYRKQSADLMEIVKLQASRPITVEAIAVAENSNRKTDLRGAQFGGNYAEVVQGSQYGGTINNYGSNTEDITRLLTILHDQARYFPTDDQQDEVIDTLKDIDRDLKENQPDQGQIGRRLKKLLALGLTITSGAVTFSSELTTFSNNVKQLAETLNIPIEQIQPKQISSSNTP